MLNKKINIFKLLLSLLIVSCNSNSDTEKLEILETKIIIKENELNSQNILQQTARTPKLNEETKLDKNLSKDYNTSQNFKLDLEIDKNGRILLSRPLRTVTEITKKIMLIGQGEKFEIWSEDTWNNRVNTWRSEETDESEESVLSDIRI